MSRKRSVVTFVVGLIVAGIAIAIPTENAHACNEQCANASKCGGNARFLPATAPGWVNLLNCASKESGDSCTSCAGPDHLKPCGSSICENDQKCVENSNGDCGEKFNGTCKTFYGGGGILECKKSGSTTGTCNTITVCTGTEDDTGCN